MTPSRSEPRLPPAELPLVSIGIPTYNRVAALRRTVASVIAQEYAHMEIVISDNASADGTQAFCEAVAAQDRRIRYVRQAVNIGGAANFEFVLQAATGPLFMYLADDDVIAPNYVSSCVRELVGDRAAVVAFAPANLTKDGAPLRRECGVDLVSDDPAERVVECYRHSSFYSEFYGLARLDVLRRAPRAPSVMYGDWMYVAGLAYLGKYRLARDTWIDKDVGGLSSRPADWARVMQMPAWHGRHPTWACVLNAFRDAAWRSGVYADRSRVARFVLAVRVCVVLRRRFRLANVGERIAYTLRRFTFSSKRR